MIFLTLDQIKRVWKLGIVANIPIATWGGPGIGKTSAANQLVEEMSADAAWQAYPVEGAWELMGFRLSDKEVTDIGGFPTIEPAVGKKPKFLDFVMNGGLPFDSKKKVIILLDEVDRVSSQDMHNAAMQLITEKSANGHHLSENSRLILLGNGSTDSATTPPTGAMANRVCHTYAKTEGPEALQSYLDYADMAGVSPALQGFAQHRQEVWSPDGKKPEDYAKATPRSFDYADRFLAVAEQVKFKTSDIIHAVVAGCVGQIAGTEFMQYRDVYANCPRIEQIAADPEGTIVPSDPGILFALTVYLTNLAEKDRELALPIGVYGLRWPADAQSYLFHRLVKKQPFAATTDPYQAFERRTN